VERTVHGRVQGARREGRHLRSFPPSRPQLAVAGSADSEIDSTFATPQLQMHVQAFSSIDIRVWPGPVSAA
jgi:hypothetical protein